jgi:hypothetical protein
MHRHWFPAILIGLTVLLALTFAVVLTPSGQSFLDTRPAVRDVINSAPKVTNDSYKQAVTSLLQTYSVDKDAEATYNALIALRVPRDMLNLHYELVIAFGKVNSGDADDASARFAALKAQYTWLPL